MRVKFIPNSGNLLIIPLTEVKRESGIILSVGGDKELPSVGTVIALPEDYTGPIKLGAVVYFGKYSGSELDIHGDKYQVLKIAELLGYYNA